MRLIDADRLRAKITAMVTRPHQVMYEIERAPTVQAIPIEYIEKFKKEFRAVASVKAVIEWLLEKWEDEQARLFEKQITEECVSAERFAEWEKENGE